MLIPVLTSLFIFVPFVISFNGPKEQAYHPICPDLQPKSGQVAQVKTATWSVSCMELDVWSLSTVSTRCSIPLSTGLIAERALWSYCHSCGLPIILPCMVLSSGLSLSWLPNNMSDMIDKLVLKHDNLPVIRNRFFPHMRQFNLMSGIQEVRQGSCSLPSQWHYWNPKWGKKYVNGPVVNFWP